MFQDLLNRFRQGKFNYEQMGNLPEVKQRTEGILNDPRQMILNTDANYMNMGANPTLINQSIPGMNMGNELGVLTAQGQGNFNIMNPFTYGNMKKAVEGTRAGDKNIQYSDSPAGQVGEAANERNRLIQQLLQGS